MVRVAAIAGLIVMNLLLGCASADGPTPSPSPEAQQEPSLVVECVRDPRVVAWQNAAGVYQVSMRTGPSGTPGAIIYNLSDVPMVVDFGELQVLVNEDLTTCVQG